VSSFTAKQLRVTLILANPFPGTQSNTLVLTGMRIIAVIQAVARLATSADIRIFGMLPADMNALTTIFIDGALLNQLVIVEANDGSGWTQVFSGTFLEAQPDYRAAPDVFFHIQARAFYFEAIAPVPPLSYPTAVSAVTVIEQIAKQLNVTVQNNGVTAQLGAGAYYPGTAYDQLQKVCNDAGVDYYIMGKVLAICPHGFAQQNVAPIILSPQSGLIGYPVIERFGVTIDCLFNPGIIGGGQIQVEGSDIPAANGKWFPFALTHVLESLVPGGSWFSNLQCGPHDLVAA
jgi:hypothetical protein